MLRAADPVYASPVAEHEPAVPVVVQVERAHDDGGLSHVTRDGPLAPALAPAAPDRVLHPSDGRCGTGHRRLAGRLLFGA